MPNWKKVIVSGSDANLRNITASSDISASGLLHASLSFDTTPVTDGVVVYDTAGGRFYYTGSYGGGGSGGTIVIKEDGVTTVAAATTIDFLNSIVTESPSGEANVAFDLQGVTDSGAVTTNGSLFLHNQNAEYGFSTSQLAKSGFEIDNSKAYTYATPQRTQNDVYLLGMHITATGVGPYPDNFVTINKDLVYNGGSGPYDGGGGGTNPDTDHPDDLGGTLVSTGTGVQILASSSVSSVTKDNKARGMYITPSALYMFNTDASASISGTLIPESASAQIRFNTASSAVEFLAGATTENLTKVLFISRSGDNPRIGIGTETPKGVFDFKDIDNSSTGAELLLRTSRTTKGAEVGDDAGLINFTIDSSSFNDIETSGSVASVAAKVLDESPDGVFGKLSFQVAESAKAGSTERLSVSPIGTHVTGVLEVSSYIRTTAQNNALGSLRVGSYGSSIDSGDLSVQGGITLFSADSNALTIKNGSLYLENAAGSRGHITASGNISSSGEIIADTGNFTSLTGSNLQILGTASIAYFEALYETSSIIFSSGSTKFGDTMDDQHDFTGSVDITGSITASGDLSLSGGTIDLKNSGAASKILFYCESNNAHAQTIQAAPHSDAASNTLILPSTGTKFATQDGTETLTNKTLTSPDINTPDIDGGTIDNTVIGNSTANAGTFTSLTATNVTASGNISASGDITSNTFETISTTLASDSATNVDTFNSSSYNGAIYDYILKDTGVGARAGQFMVAHDSGLITFTDNSTRHLSDATAPEISAQINGANVEVQVTNGNGYTFKSFVKKL